MYSNGRKYLPRIFRRRKKNIYLYRKQLKSLRVNTRVVSRWLFPSSDTSSDVSPAKFWRTGDHLLRARFAVMTRAVFRVCSTKNQLLSTCRERTIPVFDIEIVTGLKQVFDFDFDFFFFFWQPCGRVRKVSETWNCHRWSRDRHRRRRPPFCPRWCSPDRETLGQTQKANVKPPLQPNILLPDTCRSDDDGHHGVIGGFRYTYYLHPFILIARWWWSSSSSSPTGPSGYLLLSIGTRPPHTVSKQIS